MRLSKEAAYLEASKNVTAMSTKLSHLTASRGELKARCSELNNVCQKLESRVNTRHSQVLRLIRSSRCRRYLHTLFIAWKTVTQSNTQKKLQKRVGLKGILLRVGSKWVLRAWLQWAGAVRRMVQLDRLAASVLRSNSMRQSSYATRRVFAGWQAWSARRARARREGALVKLQKVFVHDRAAARELWVRDQAQVAVRRRHEVGVVHMHVYEYCNSGRYTNGPGLALQSNTSHR